MKYAIMTCLNRLFAVTTPYSTLDKAKAGFHQSCAAMWDAKNVSEAVLRLVDENLTTVVTEHIHHDDTESKGNMTYAIMTYMDSTFVVSKKYSTLDKAKVDFYQKCSLVWDAENVLEAEISIVDENLTTVVTEHIHHDAPESKGD